MAPQNPQLLAISEQMDEVRIAAQAIYDAADADGRELTDAEAQQVEEHASRLERLQADLERRQRLLGATAAPAGGSGRQTAPTRPAGSQGAATAGSNGRSAPVSPQARREAGLFANQGEFFRAVYQAAMPGATPDNRLQAGMASSPGEAGGYAIPPDWREEIWKRITFESQLIQRATQIQTARSGIKMPTYEEEPWGSIVQAQWLAEAAQKPLVSPPIGLLSVDLNKIAAVVTATDELLEDAPAIEGLIRTALPEAMRFQIEGAMIAGTGVNQPLGILNAIDTGVVGTTKGPTLIITKNTGTPAGTFTYADIVHMWGAMYAPRRANSVWLVNPAAEAQLLLLEFNRQGAAPGTGGSDPVPIYLQGGTAASAPYSSLMGRPVVPHWACPAPGQPGDIILADWSQYLLLTKAGGLDPRIDTSIHVKFMTDETAFRFVIRVGGRPKASRAIKPPAGQTFKQTSFVALEAR